MNPSLDPARVAEARKRETALRSADVRAAAARARAALPTCDDGPPPVPATAETPPRRIEGTYDTHLMSLDMTDNLCPVANPCCVWVSPHPWIRLDPGAPEEPNESSYMRHPPGRAPIPMTGKARALFGLPGRREPLSECDLQAWLEGFGTPRLRLTWYPFSPGRRSLEVVELCEVRPAKKAP